MNSLVHGFENKNTGVIKLDITLDEDEVVMTYSDNGRGLSESDLNKLFDAFFTTRRGEGGSGLGTHIIYNLVTQSLSGSIEANSELGKGLTYLIRFPLRRN